MGSMKKKTIVVTMDLNKKKLIMLKLNILRTQLQKCLRNCKADADVSHICSPKKLYNTWNKRRKSYS